MTEMNVTHTETLSELLTVVATTIDHENSKAIAALREDKDQRHQTANLSQTAIDMASANRIRIENLEAKVSAVMGDGTGETGALAKMGERQRQTQTDLTEVKGDVKQIKEALADLKTIGEQSKSALSGGKALITTLGIISTFCAVVGGIVAGILWVYKH